MKKLKKTGILFAVILCALFVFHNISYAINIPLKRIIFEGPTRSETLTITNETKKTQTYTLEWQHYRMKEVKGLVGITHEDEMEGVRWADKMIRFEEPQIVIPPGKSKKARLIFDPPSGLETGEYRSHLSIRTEVPPEASAKNAKAGMNLSMQPAITLPVFVRHGDMTATAEIADLIVLPKENGPHTKIKLTLKRTGNRSLFGDFEFVCMAGEQKNPLKKIRGLAVYTEVDQRQFTFKIKIPDSAQKTCQQIQVNYKSLPDDALFKGKIMASASTDNYR